MPEIERSKTMKVKTRDLYCGAYIISKGGTLEDVKLAEDGHNGRPAVTFILSGDNVDVLSREFHHGKANANVVALRAAVDQLKGIMFNLINEHSTH
jgi:hypothetical protein